MLSTIRSHCSKVIYHPPTLPVFLTLGVPERGNNAIMDSSKEFSENFTAVEMDDMGESGIVDQKYIGTEADQMDMWKLGRKQVVRVSRRQAI